MTKFEGFAKVFEHANAEGDGSKYMSANSKEECDILQSSSFFP